MIGDSFASLASLPLFAENPATMASDDQLAILNRFFMSQKSFEGLIAAAIFSISLCGWSAIKTLSMKWVQFTLGFKQVFDSQHPGSPVRPLRVYTSPSVLLDEYVIAPHMNIDVNPVVVIANFIVFKWEIAKHAPLDMSNPQWTTLPVFSPLDQRQVLGHIADGLKVVGIQHDSQAPLEICQQIYYHRCHIMREGTYFNGVPSAAICSQTGITPQNPTYVNHLMADSQCSPPEELSKKICEWVHDAFEPFQQIDRAHCAG